MKHSLSILLLVFIMYSCQDFLEEERFGQLDVTTAFDDNGSEAAVNAAYGELRANNLFGQRWMFVQELPSPNVTTRRSGGNVRAELDNYTYNNTNGYLNDIYGQSYVVIGRTNFVIDAVGSSDLVSDEMRQRVIAEAQFIRGLVYFGLVASFGGVPLQLTSPENYQATLDADLPVRATAAEVYAQVISDLEAAAAVLPGVDEYAADDVGRATRGAARALLAKVYAQRAATPGLGGASDLQEALRYARLVVEDEPYDLVEDYAHLWGLDSENFENNEEIIFDIQAVGDQIGLGYGLTAHIAPRRSGLGPAQWTNFHAEIPFYLSYEVGDYRREVTFIPSFTEGNGTEVSVFDCNLNQVQGIPFRKYVDADAINTANGGNNIVIIRLADILLLLAELENEINDGPTDAAIEAVNRVRRRAFRNDSLVADYTVADFDYTSFREYLYAERSRELVMEGHGVMDGRRFFDIFSATVEAHSTFGDTTAIGCPIGNVIPDVVIDVEPRHRIFPIPQAVIDNNPEITQNEGW